MDHQHKVGLKDDLSRLTRPPYSKPDPKDERLAKYKGNCFCGSVEFELFDDPLDASYCHCRDCQRLHGAPYQWAAIFHKTDMHFTKGQEDLIFYSVPTKATEYVLPVKISCAVCHGPIADEGRRMMLVFPELVQFDFNLLPGPFRATHHMFYGSRVEDVHDDIPKFLGKKGECPFEGESKGPESIDKLTKWRTEHS
ncbi:hypothetical protein BD410DRAFT_900446 [Rickenella mellea]|uniref:CENP-V/GFA domain-containing protein n=1 Tax=Rickenella mellea TaxID=50990 RepID=A0A4Y7PX51_9AGAM|nr:hypothetical protein BD410DRAFT_900446 [Rickenella mellea]